MAVYKLQSYEGGGKPKRDVCERRGGRMKRNEALRCCQAKRARRFCTFTRQKVIFFFKKINFLKQNPPKALRVRTKGGKPECDACQRRGGGRIWDFCERSL